MKYIYSEINFEHFTYRIIVVLIWILALGSIRPYGRLMPYNMSSMDWIVAFKIATRIFAFIVIGVSLVRISSTERFSIIKSRIFPLVLFALWAIISTLWSPLKVLTFGKAFGLMLCIMLIANVAWISLDEKFLSKILFQLSMMLFIISFLCLISLLLFPVDDVHGRGGLLIGKNDGAQIAGIGILILINSNILYKWDWARLLLIPGVCIETGVLLVANSRTATFATLIVIILSFAILLKFRQILTISFFPVIFAIAILSYNLFVDSHNPIGTNIKSYFLRGQTNEEFVSFTGRPDKWKLAIDGFLISPIIGHGYTVLSPTGYQHLYGRDQIVNAHNLYLCILSGTGLVGTTLFIWGFLRILSKLIQHLQSSSRNRALFVLFAMLWFFMVGVFELSFLSSISTPGVVAFVLFGIGVGIRAKKTSYKQINI